MACPLPPSFLPFEFSYSQVYSANVLSAHSMSTSVNTPVNAPVNATAQPATVNAPAARGAAAKTAMMAANTVYPISQLLDAIVANPTGFFKIVEKEPPKGGRAPAAKPAQTAVKYYKQQWDLGGGVKFIGNLKFNLVGNALTAEEIPETVHELSREDLLNGKVRMYRGIGDINDTTDHRNSYAKNDGKSNENGLFKVAVSSTDAGKLGRFMILLDAQWIAECNRIKATDELMEQSAINKLTSSIITQGEHKGTKKDAPTFSIRIPINETYPAAFRSRAGQPKSIILDAATRYISPKDGTTKFLKAAIETAEGQTIVDATNAWQFVEGGSKFVAESEFEFNDPNCSGFGFAMSLIATAPAIERRSGGGGPSGSNLVGDEDEYLAAINGAGYTAPTSSAVAPSATTTTTTTTAAQPSATPVVVAGSAEDKAMMDLLNQFQ